MKRQARLRFVVQEHKGRNLHYDFRLEWAGVLKSWAVPKGPSMDPVDKRLAVQVEDHPLEHMDYEGIIPPETYGAGPVLIWDKGLFEPQEGDLDVFLSGGRITFRLEGKKLQGEFALVRLRKGAKGNEWLLMKKKDSHAQQGWKLLSLMTEERLRRLKVKAPPCSTVS